MGQGETCRRHCCYDELAANYLVFIQLASIRLWLGANAGQHSFNLTA
jgi:hypothetical protein